MSIVDPGNIECDLQSGALAGFKVNINSSLIPFFGLPGGSGSKESACNEEDTGLIPGSGRFPGERNGNPLHYPCLGNPRTEEPGRLQSMGSQRVRQDLVTNTLTSFLFIKAPSPCSPCPTTKITEGAPLVVVALGEFR